MSAKDLEVELQSALRDHRAQDAAHLCVQLGRHAQAGELFERSGSFWDACLAFRLGGNTLRALQAVVRVPANAPNYPVAARAAIELAAGQQLVFHDLEQFLSPYLARPVQSQDDADALLLLAQLFDETSYLPQSLEVLRLVLDFAPQHVLAKQLRRQVERKASQSSTREVELDRHDVRALRELLRVESPKTKAAGSPPAAAAPRAEPSAATAPTGAHILAGRYLIKRQLGEGAFAVVYEVLDQQLGEHVALKLMHILPPDTTATTRFRREVSLARNLSHPNIVRIYDLGQHESRQFFTMELVDGDNLHEYLRGNRVSLAQRRDLLLQALDGLGFAHQCTVVHRDIKPENMFVTRGGNLKLADFGMAKNAQSPALTASGIMGGTPSYISPEQITDLRTADWRSDLYSLGAVAYELFVGSPPFYANELPALLMMHLERLPEPMRKHRRELPAALDTVVLKLLQKRKEDRFQTAAEARAALASVPL